MKVYVLIFPRFFMSDNVSIEEFELRTLGFYGYINAPTRFVRIIIEAEPRQFNFKTKILHICPDLKYFFFIATHNVSVSFGFLAKHGFWTQIIQVLNLTGISSYFSLEDKRTMYKLLLFLLMLHCKSNSEGNLPPLLELLWLQR